MKKKNLLAIIILVVLISFTFNYAFATTCQHSNLKCFVEYNMTTHTKCFECLDCEAIEKGLPSSHNLGDEYDVLFYDDPYYCGEKMADCEFSINSHSHVAGCSKDCGASVAGNMFAHDFDDGICTACGYDMYEN